LPATAPLAPVILLPTIWQRLSRSVSAVSRWHQTPVASPEPGTSSPAMSTL